MNEQQIGKASNIASLIVGRMQHTLTPEQQTQLDNWLQEDGENYLLYEELMDDEKLGTALDQLHAIDHKDAYQKLAQKLSLNQNTVQETPKRTISKLWWYMAAALVILVPASIIYMSSNSEPAQMPAPQVTAQHKAPGAASDSDKALLILADNTTIELNAMNNGSIAQQGNSTVQKNKNGELQYHFKGAVEYASVPYNTIKTPRGGEYQVTLDDGTRIWLNAASTLRYPVHFAGEERRIELEGEAYFEVASSTSAKTGQKRTFTVRANEMDVQAIGTAFNISAYKNDQQTQTTVVEGLVKVSARQQDQLLSPGRKLVITDSTLAVMDADITLETNWKNGYFDFRNTAIDAVMNEVARWYDVEVVFDPRVPTLHLTGQISRQDTIDQVLEKLAMTGSAHFVRKDRVVSVLPAIQY